MELLHEPRMAQDRRIKMIEAARDEILVRTPELRLLSREVLAALTKKARSGVSVKVLTAKRNFRYFTTLRRGGVEAKLSRREFSLMLITDRRHVMAGSDLSVLLEGLAAEMASSHFGNCWESSGRAKTNIRHKNYVMLGSQYATELLHSIALAEHDLTLCVPELSSAQELIQALREARNRGVRVSVVAAAPCPYARPFAHASFLNARRRLLNTGVNFRSVSGPIVSRYALIDKTWAYVDGFGIQAQRLCNELESGLGSLPCSEQKKRPLLANVLRPFAFFRF